MAFDAGSIIGKLVLDDSKWKAAIETAKADTKSLEGAILKNSGAITKMGATLAITGAAITAISAKFVSAAARAQDMERVFALSFGKSADEVTQWSEIVGKQIGVSDDNLREAALSFNNFLKGLDLSGDAASKMSESLTVLSYDLASFYRISQDEALQKLRGGLVGMTRPLKELGIVISETGVKQWALTNGIIKQGEELTEQQQVYARYALIVKATTQAQGDAARTQDGLTGYTRRLGDALADISRIAGNQLLPTYTGLIGTGAKLSEGLMDLMNAYPVVTQYTVVFGAALGIVATVGGAVLLMLPSLAAAAAAAGTTIGAVAAGVSLTFLGWAAAITAVVYALQNFEFLKAIFYTFSEAVNSALSFAIKGLSNFLDWLAKISPIAKDSLRDARDSMSEIAHGFEENADLMRDASFSSLQAQERKNAETMSSMKVEVKGLGDEYSKLYDNMVNDAKNAGDKIKSNSNGWLQDMLQSFNYAEEMGKRTFNAMADSISGTLYDAVTGTFTSLQDVASSFGKSILKIMMDMLAQWMTMKIMMGIGSIFTAGASAGASAVSSEMPYTASAVNLPSFDVGTESVPYDMIAKVHKGEEIRQPGESSGGVIKLTIHNAITPEAIASGMQSREGVSTIINVINSDSLRNGVTRREVKTR